MIWSCHLHPRPKHARPTRSFPASSTSDIVPLSVSAVTSDADRRVCGPLNVDPHRQSAHSYRLISSRGTYRVNKAAADLALVCGFNSPQKAAIYSHIKIQYMYITLRNMSFSKKSRRKRERELFRDNQACTGRVTFCLLFTDSVNHWTWVCYAQWSRLSRLSLDAFINSIRWVGSCLPAVRKFVTETGLTVCQYTVRRMQYDRLSQQQLSSGFYTV